MQYVYGGFFVKKYCLVFIYLLEFLRILVYFFVFLDSEGIIINRKKKYSMQLFGGC